MMFLQMRLPFITLVYIGLYQAKTNAIYIILDSIVEADVNAYRFDTLIFLLPRVDGATAAKTVTKLRPKTPVTAVS